MPDDPSTARRAAFLAKGDALPRPREGRAVVLEAGAEWLPRIRQALHADPDIRWTVSAVDGDALAEPVDDRAGTLLIVAPDMARLATALEPSADSAQRSVISILDDGAPSPTGATSVELSVGEATPARLRAVCARELELLELRLETQRWRTRFRDLYDRSLAGLYRLDASGVVIEANETFARLLGYDSRAAIVGVQLFEFVDHEAEPRPLCREAGGSRPFWSRRVCLRRRDGSQLRGLLNDQRLGSADSGLFEGSLIEATREHDLAADLERQEALYVEIFGAMTEPTLLLDEDGVVLACNRRAEHLLDRRALELVGRRVEEGVAELLSIDGSSVAPAESVLFAGAGDDGSEESTLGIRRHDGKTLWVMVRSRRIPSPRGRRQGQFLVSMVDRTDLRELSDRAQRAEVESLLTQGLVHDVRNLLTAVRAAANFLEEESDNAEEVRAYAEQIDRVATSANVLLSRALEHDRGRESTALAIDQLITDLSPMLRRAARNRVLTVRTGAEGCRVRGDRVGLEQILFNLLSNAREALEPGGRVALRTHVVEAADGGRTLVLEVEDEGCGMSEEIRRRAFEPLFTSRRERGGGGLGLFNVALIAREMGGRVSIESEPGKGTVARLELPVLPEPNDKS